MRLEEVAKKKGTYAGVRFDHDTKMRIQEYIKKNKIPNPLSPYKMHNTLIYSRKHLPDFKAQGRLDPAWVGEPTKFDVWESQSDEDTGEKTKCLILKFECTECVERHNEIMDKHGATHDFDKYYPHITLSYDIGNFDIKSLPDPAKEIGDLKIVQEYREDLNLDWAKDNT